MIAQNLWFVNAQCLMGFLIIFDIGQAVDENRKLKYNKRSC